MLLEDRRQIARPQLLRLRTARARGHGGERRPFQSAGRLLVTDNRNAPEEPGRYPSDWAKSNRSHLDDPQGLKDLSAGVSVARAIGNSAALRPFTGREIAPGRLNVEELDRFFRDGLGTFWHQSGTAKMGRDTMSVVDGALKVYGVEGLRVADASIMPRVTTGNTMAPCVVIGERAAAFLAEQLQDGGRREDVAAAAGLDPRRDLNRA